MQFKKWQNNESKEIGEQIHKIGSETDLDLKEGERKMLLSQAGDQQSLGSFSSFLLNEKLIYFPLSRKEKLIPNVLCILFAGASLKSNSWGKCSC